MIDEGAEPTLKTFFQKKCIIKLCVKPFYVTSLNMVNFWADPDASQIILSLQFDSKFSGNCY